MKQKEIMNDIPNKAHLRKEIMRLGLVTWAISQELSLEYNIPTVLGSLKYKDLKTLVQKLNIPTIDNVWLFDDKAHIHHEKMPTTALNPEEVHMIRVTPYETALMPPTNRVLIQNLLNELLIHKDEFWSKEKRLLRDVSIPTDEWPVDHCIWDSRTHQFKIGLGHISYARGSGPVEHPWPTHVFGNENHSASRSHSV
jgi:hypothetical protein